MDRFAEIREKVVPVLLPYGVKWIGVFGSFARGEDTADSDIDILVDFDEPRKRPLGLFTWVRLEREISERLGRKIDMVSNQGLNKYIRPYVEPELITLYEKEG